MHSHGKFFLTTQTKWQQTPKIHLIHAHCHTLHAYKRPSTSLTQHKTKAQVLVCEQRQACCSQTTLAAVPGSHAPLSQRKRQLLGVRKIAGSSMLNARKDIGGYVLQCSSTQWSVLAATYMAQVCLRLDPLLKAYMIKLLVGYATSSITADSI